MRFIFMVQERFLLLNFGFELKKQPRFSMFKLYHKSWYNSTFSEHATRYRLTQIAAPSAPEEESPTTKFWKKRQLSHRQISAIAVTLCVSAVACTMTVVLSVKLKHLEGKLEKFVWCFGHSGIPKYGRGSFPHLGKERTILKIFHYHTITLHLITSRYVILHLVVVRL